MLTFSATALGLAGRIYTNVKQVNNDGDLVNQCNDRASTNMAIVVGSIAIPYLGYVTWDEYMSKPYVLSLPTNPPNPRGTAGRYGCEFVC